MENNLIINNTTQKHRKLKTVQHEHHKEQRVISGVPNRSEDLIHSSFFLTLYIYFLYYIFFISGHQVPFDKGQNQRNFYDENS